MVKHVEIKNLPPLYWIASTLLMLSPPYWCYPPACIESILPLFWIPSTVLKLSLTVLMLSPLFWTTSTVLKVSPTVLMLSPTCTAVIPPPPPTVVKLSLHSTEYHLQTLHSTDNISHTTDVIPLHVLIVSPTVLNNLYSTEAIPSTNIRQQALIFTRNRQNKLSCVAKCEKKNGWLGPRR